jgi:hypothetical protein
VAGKYVIGGLRGKSIRLSIADFELRISDFLGFFSIRIPQSTIRNPDRPPGPRNDLCLMVFARAALPSGSRNALKFGRACA